MYPVATGRMDNKIMTENSSSPCICILKALEKCKCKIDDVYSNKDVITSNSRAKRFKVNQVSRCRRVKDNSNMAKRQKATGKPSTCFRHYIMNSDKVLTPAHIFSVASLYFETHHFKVKRIRKEFAFYTRFSVSKDCDALQANRTLAKISKVLSCTFKLQEAKRNPELELRLKEKAVLESKLSVITLNVNGFKSRAEELALMLAKHKPDLLCLQETHRKVDQKPLFVPGYSIFEVCAAERGLGLLVGIRRRTQAYMSAKRVSEHLCRSNIVGKGFRLQMTNVYRTFDIEARKALDRSLRSTLRACADNNRDMVMLGDWNDGPGSVQRRLSREGCTVLSTDVPTKGTRIRKSGKRTSKCIDFAVANSPSLIIRQQVLKRWRLSDHLPILVHLNLTAERKKKVRGEVLDRARIRLPEVRKKISEYKFAAEQNVDVIDPVAFTAELKELLYRLRVLRLEYPRSKLGYLSDAVKSVLAHKRRINLLVQQGRARTDDYTAIAAKAKNCIASARRGAFLRHIKNGIYHLKNKDIKSAWSWLKRHTKLSARSASPELVYRHGTSIPETDPDKRLNIWKEHFERLCRPPEKCNYRDSSYETDNRLASVTDELVTWSELQNALNSTKNGKACGVDGIPTEVYKIVERQAQPKSSLAVCLLNCINAVFSRQCIPDAWNDCIVVPIHKKGDRCDPNNYRGISLICSASKLLTKVLASRLMNAAIDYGLLAREQSGFVRREECVAQATCLLEACQRRLYDGEYTYLLFLDLKKAYDMVPHELLFAKLKKLGFSDRFTRLLQKMYENTYIRVRIGSSLSERVKYSRGVRQGCPISPILFNLFIDDILKDIEPVAVRGLRTGLRGLMYADDTVIVGETYDDVAAKLALVEQWIAKNGMEINANKCGLMHIKDASEASIPLEPLKYNGEYIPVVDRYVYLGVEFNDRLNYDWMSQYRLGKASRVLGTLKATLSNTKIPMEYKTMLLKSIVLPTMLFGSEVFGMSKRRSGAMTQILDRGIQFILKRHNFDRRRAYEEFGLKAPYVASAVSRYRGYYKWVNNRSLISDLIESHDEYKSRKRTWAKNTRVWLRTQQLENLEVGQACKRIVTADKSKYLMKDASKIGAFCNRLRIGSGKMIRGAEINARSSTTGVYYLTQIRTGTFMFSRRLVFAGLISQQYKAKCVGCKAHVIEDAWHFITECSAFCHLRRSFMPKSISCINRVVSVNDRDRLLGILLGGEWDVAKRQQNALVFETIEYLARACVWRLSLVNEASSCV